ncbi:MAG: response regulator transcription factor [Nitrospira sp.]|nr:MAG: response regulator transcription factor [Nitrospira sp.]
MDEIDLGRALKGRFVRTEMPHPQSRIPNSQRDLVQPIRAGRTSRMIRLMIADNQELIRLGLHAMLAQEPGLSIIGEADSLAETIAKVEQVRPDLLLLEYHLPDGSGAEACRLLLKKNSKIRILIMSWDNRMTTFRRVMKAGAHGFVYKDICRAELLRTIRLMARGDSNLNSIAVNRVPGIPRRADGRSDGSRLSLLSPQERRILPLLAEGKTNKEIALKLALAERTIKNYIANMFRKLKIGRRVQAAAIYLQAPSYGAL